MPKRVDANQPDMTKLLRIMGASVQPIHVVGKGCPDLLVGYDGLNYLLEIKDPIKPPSARKLTDDEQKWHENWRGQVAVVETIGDVIEIILKSKRGNESP